MWQLRPGPRISKLRFYKGTDAGKGWDRCGFKKETDDSKGRYRWRLKYGKDRDKGSDGWRKGMRKMEVKKRSVAEKV